MTFLAHAHVSLTENRFFSIFNPQPLYSFHASLSHLFSTILYPVFLVHHFYVSAAHIIITIPFLSFRSCT